MTGAGSDARLCPGVLAGVGLGFGLFRTAAPGRVHATVARTSSRATRGGRRATVRELCPRGLRRLRSTLGWAWTVAKIPALRYIR